MDVRPICLLGRLYQLWHPLFWAYIQRYIFPKRILDGPWPQSLDNGTIDFLNLNLLFWTFWFSFPTTTHIRRVQNRPFTLRPVAFRTIQFGGEICGSTETKPITHACHKGRHIAVMYTNDTDKTTLQNSSRHRNTRSKPTSLTIVEVQVLCVNESRTYKYEVMNREYLTAT